MSASTHTAATMASSARGDEPVSWWPRSTHALSRHSSVVLSVLALLTALLCILKVRDQAALPVASVAAAVASGSSACGCSACGAAVAATALPVVAAVLLCLWLLCLCLLCL